MTLTFEDDLDSVMLKRDVKLHPTNQLDSVKLNHSMPDICVKGHLVRNLFSVDRRTIQTTERLIQIALPGALN